MNLLNRRAWGIDFAWQRLLLGVILPHGGMDVWTLCLGPLSVHFWPNAWKGDEVAF